MRHKFPVLTVKKLLKSVYIYGSYRKNEIGVPFFGPPCTPQVGLRMYCGSGTVAHTVDRIENKDIRFPVIGV